jgi:hypothetical protein
MLMTSNAFGNGEIDTCGIPLSLGNLEMEQAVAVELRNAGVTIRWMDGVVCADKHRRKTVQRIVAEVVGRYLDPANSVALHRQILGGVRLAFQENNISFTEIEFQGTTYFVWSPEDSEVAESIIGREKEIFLKSVVR